MPRSSQRRLLTEGERTLLRLAREEGSATDISNRYEQETGKAIPGCMVYTIFQSFSRKGFVNIRSRTGKDGVTEGLFTITPVGESALDR